MKKSYVVISCLTLAVLLFSGGYLIAHYRGKAALAEQKAQSEVDKAAALAQQIAAQNVIIAQGAADLAKAEADAAANEKAFLAVLAQVKTATPQQLVDQGAQITGAKDITTDGRSVVMGVETYRQFVTIAVDWKEYRDVREPGWAKEKGLLNDQINGYKAREALQGQRDAALQASIADLKQAIGAAKAVTFFDKIIYAAGGLGVGMLVGKYMK